MVDKPFCVCLYVNSCRRAQTMAVLVQSIVSDHLQEKLYLESFKKYRDL